MAFIIPFWAFCFVEKKSGLKFSYPEIRLHDCNPQILSVAFSLSITVDLNISSSAGILPNSALALNFFFLSHWYHPILIFLCPFIHRILLQIQCVKFVPSLSLLLSKDSLPKPMNIISTGVKYLLYFRIVRNWEGRYLLECKVSVFPPISIGVGGDGEEGSPLS